MRSIKIAGVAALLAATMAASTLGQGGVSGLGYRGEQVDPYGLTFQRSFNCTACCFTHLFFKSELRELCADDDGCTLRLVHDSALRSISVSVNFVTDALALRWSLEGTFFDNPYSGVSGDGKQDVLIQVIASGGPVVPRQVICELRDEAPSTVERPGRYYELWLCRPDTQHGTLLSCTLRVDD